MFTNLILSILHFPAWLKHAKAEHRYLYDEVLGIFCLAAALVFNFFSFRNDVIYGILMLFVPFAWIVFNIVKNQIRPVPKKNVPPTEDRLAYALPGLALFFADVAGSLFLIYGKGAWGEPAYDEFAFLILAGLLHLVIYRLLRINPFRGQLFFDILLWILDFVLILAMFSLSATIRH